MIYVYYSVFPDMRGNLDLSALPPEWENYVASITDEKRRTQSYYVRKLLLRVYNDLGVNAKRFICNDGKWSADGESSTQFSLSHSGKVVAAAISTDGNVGVDVEIISEKILKLEKKTPVAANLGAAEKALRLTEKWTEAESAFKCGVKKTDDVFFKQITLTDGDGEYVLCVAACDEEAVEKAQILRIKDI